MPSGNGLPSSLYAAPNLVVKVQYQGGNEATVGYATNLVYRVTQGQKPIFTVDSPFPAEIAQGASPSFVQGSMTLFLPKGTTVESMGLVPRRLGQQGEIIVALSQYYDINVYNKETNELVVSIQRAKVGDYTVTIGSRNVVVVSLNFIGTNLKEGVTY